MRFIEGRITNCDLSLSFITSWYQSLLSHQVSLSLLSPLLSCCTADGLWLWQIKHTSEVKLVIVAVTRMAADYFI